MVVHRLNFTHVIPVAREPHLIEIQPLAPGRRYELTCSSVTTAFPQTYVQTLQCSSPVFPILIVPPPAPDAADEITTSGRMFQSLLNSSHVSHSSSHDLILHFGSGGFDLSYAYAQAQEHYEQSRRRQSSVSSQELKHDVQAYFVQAYRHLFSLPETRGLFSRGNHVFIGRRPPSRCGPEVAQWAQEIQRRYQHPGWTTEELQNEKDSSSPAVVVLVNETKTIGMIELPNFHHHSVKDWKNTTSFNVPASVECLIVLSPTESLVSRCSAQERHWRSCHPKDDERRRKTMLTSHEDTLEIRATIVDWIFDWKDAVASRAAMIFGCSWEDEGRSSFHTTIQRNESTIEQVVFYCGGAHRGNTGHQTADDETPFSSLSSWTPLRSWEGHVVRSWRYQHRPALEKPQEIEEGGGAGRGGVLSCIPASDFISTTSHMFYRPIVRPNVLLGPVIGRVTRSSGRVLLELDAAVPKCLATCTSESGQTQSVIQSLVANRPHVFEFTNLEPDTWYRISFPDVAPSDFPLASFQTLPSRPLVTRCCFVSNNGAIHRGVSWSVEKDDARRWQKWFHSPAVFQSRVQNILEAFRSSQSWNATCSWTTLTTFPATLDFTFHMGKSSSILFTCATQLERN